jgi:hypothetical protein
MYRPIIEQGAPSVATAAVRNLPRVVLDGGENGELFFMVDVALYDAHYANDSNHCSCHHTGV